jgi:hypothetical protein
VAHQGIVPNHHFAAASSECIDLYRDGYALSAVMVSQAVAEGICGSYSGDIRSRPTGIVQLRQRHLSNARFFQRSIVQWSFDGASTPLEVEVSDHLVPTGRRVTGITAYFGVTPLMVKNCS